VNKSAQIQLRVSPSEKAALVRRARAAGLDLSAWMLRSLLPDERKRFADLVRTLGKTAQPAFALAEVSDLLASLKRGEFSRVTDVPPSASLDEVLANQLAAMVETRAAELGVRPPEWVGRVEPLRVPWFATTLLTLRLHLLVNSPPVFRRRNLFVDATVGDRV
jgi:hypothetical protein